MEQNIGMYHVFLRLVHKIAQCDHSYKFQTALGEYEDKVAILSDADSVWTDVRHLHMREAIDKLMADFNKFMQENAGFKGSVGAFLSSFFNC